jgi:hypothetical protein
VRPCLKKWRERERERERERDTEREATLYASYAGYEKENSFVLRQND